MDSVTKFLKDANSLDASNYSELIKKVDAILLHELKKWIESSEVPELFIKALLDGANNDYHLVLLVKLIKKGIDHYITKDNEKLHIIYYIYQGIDSMPKEKVMYKNTMVLLLQLLGISTKEPVLKNSTNSVKILVGIALARYPLIGINIEKDKNRIDSDLLTKLAILTDIPDLINKNGLIAKFPLIEIVRDDAINTFRTYLPFILRDLNAIDLSFNNLNVIDLTIKFLNLKMFCILLNHGIYPNYNQINILLLQVIHQNGNIKREYSRFLYEFLLRNGQLDNYQRELLSNPPDIKKTVTDYGNILMESPPQFSDIDYLRMKYLSGKNFGPDARLTKVNIPNDCLDILKHDDTIITSDMYEEILSGNSNNYPKDDINTRRGLLKRLGYKLNKSKSSLNREDLNVKKEKAFIDLVKLELNKDITKISVSEMSRILGQLGIGASLLELLTFEHYRRTFYLSYYEKLKDNLESLTLLK
jgi:hypothetical protein